MKSFKDKIIKGGGYMVFLSIDKSLEYANVSQF